jgi:hypothetical protein
MATFSVASKIAGIGWGVTSGRRISWLIDEKSRARIPERDVGRYRIASRDYIPGDR